MIDTVTVIRALGRRLAKRVRGNGVIEAYDRARLFDFHSRPVGSLEDVQALLRRLAGRPDCAVIRGEPTGPMRDVRRLLHADPRTGDAPTLRDVPRRWLALDIERTPLPPSVPPDDLIACARIALRELPAPFRAARCLAQATGSHGLRPDLRLRLWFWCDRPMHGTELKRWLLHTPADPSVFGAAQLIYTASPIFAAGIADPLGSRLAMVEGEPLLACPSAAALAPPPRKSAPPAALARVTDRYLTAALESAAQRIATAEKRHPVILAEACGLARFVRAGRLAESLYRALLIRAGEAAGKHDAAEIESLAAWALEHAGEAAHA